MHVFGWDCFSFFRIWNTILACEVKQWLQYFFICIIYFICGAVPSLKMLVIFEKIQLKSVKLNNIILSSPQTYKSRRKGNTCIWNWYWNVGWPDLLKPNFARASLVNFSRSMSLRYGSMRFLSCCDLFNLFIIVPVVDTFKEAYFYSNKK